jgi:hypothetical protein
MGIVKKAVTVDEGGPVSRVVASTLGRINPESWLNLILTRNALNDPSRTLSMKKDKDKLKQHTRTAKLLAKYDPEALKRTLVRLGGTDLVDDLFYQKERDKELPWHARIGGRVWQNPKTSILGKLIGTASIPIQNLLTSLNRGSNYNPFSDTATIFQHEDPIVEHELGHALDFNKLYGLRPDEGEGVLGRLNQELKGSMRDAYMLGYMKFPIVRLLAEAQANIESQKALNFALKDKPEELKARNKRRLEVLPAGYASYVANAAVPGLGAPGGIAGMLIGKTLGLGAAQAYDYATDTEKQKSVTPAKPKLKMANSNCFKTLAKAAASRCWTGYEPVPGKTPYSEDSCRPIGSKPKKKKEKKAKSDWHNYAEMTQDVEPEFQESRQDMIDWIKETSRKKRKKAAGCDCSSQKCDNCGTAPCECNSDVDVTRLAKIAANLIDNIVDRSKLDKLPSPWFKPDLSSSLVPAKYFRKPNPTPYVGDGDRRNIKYVNWSEDFYGLRKRQQEAIVEAKNIQQMINSPISLSADPSNVKNKDYSIARSFMTPRAVLSGKALKTNNPFASK